MGSCLSSINNNNKNKNKNKKTKKNHTKKHAKVQECKTPPSLEETVKEVLSSSEKTSTINAPTDALQDLKFSILNSKKRNTLKPHKEKKHVLTKEDTSEATTEVSSSLTESVSTICTTSRDDNDIMHVLRKAPANLQPKNRSFSGDFGSGRDKNGGSVRMVRSKNSSRVDPGERRCRSPVMRVGGGYATKADLSRSFSCRRSNRYPCWVNGPSRVNKKLSESLSSKESLDNPIVSLECFIFL